MTKNRTNNSTYPSRYSPEAYVTPAQYITELICEKKAKCEQKDLPIKFWELKEWQKYYKYQIILANRLIKKYDPEFIIQALKDNRLYKTYSLGSPFLIKIIEEYKNKKPIIIIEEMPEIKKNPTFKNNCQEKSIISKLRDLDEI